MSRVNDKCVMYWNYIYFIYRQIKFVLPFQIWNSKYQIKNLFHSYLKDWVVSIEKIWIAVSTSLKWRKVKFMVIVIHIISYTLYLELFIFVPYKSVHIL